MKSLPNYPIAAFQKKIAWTTILAFLVLTYAEGASRLVDFTKSGRPRSPDDSIGARHELLGSCLNPGAVTAHVTINSLGLRGPEVPLARTPGHPRIVCLGSSITFGQNAVSDVFSYPGALERLLNAATGEKVEVINAGVPAHTSLQFLLRLKEEIVPLSPDVVLLGDGLDNIMLASALADNPWIGLPERPHFMRTVHWVYILDELTTPLLRLSFARMLRDAFSWLFPEPVKSMPSSPEGLWRFGLDKYIEHTDATVDFLLHSGIKPVLVNFPALPAQASIFDLSPQRMDMLEFATEHLHEANRIIAARYGVPLIDVSAKFTRHSADLCEQFALFSDFVHFSSQGYALFANILAKGLLTNTACLQALHVAAEPNFSSMELQYQTMLRSIDNIPQTSGFVSRTDSPGTTLSSLSNIKPSDPDSKGWRSYRALDAACQAVIVVESPGGGWLSNCLLFYPRGSSPEGKVEVRTIDSFGVVQTLKNYSPATRQGVWTPVGARHLIDLPEQARGQRIEIALSGEVEVWGDASGVLFDLSRIGKVAP
jgi:lysophospholipase L1-like esterase